jgi:DNA polymerase
VDLLGDDPPRDLAAFRSWWLEAPGLDAIGPRGRVPPRGTLGAALMVLVTDPEEGDRERLLDGPQGRLLAAFLAAAGLAESEVYLASSLPRHTPMADTVRLAAGGMDAVTLHHIALAAPQRVLALGTGLAPLIGHSTAQDISGLDNINHKGRSIPLMVSEGLESLIAMPRLKARLWRRWIEWSQDFTVQR